MTPAFDRLLQQLRKLPGLGPRSAERIALHVVVGKPAELPHLIEALQAAGQAVHRCSRCGNLAEEELCLICADPKRLHRLVCVVEQVPDLVAIERSGSWRGVYHVLHGKLSPLHNVGPAELNFAPLLRRIASGEAEELVLALPNDVEGEATCHYLTSHLPPGGAIRLTRIGFGLPSGGGVLYADSVTLRNALDGRRTFQ